MATIQKYIKKDGATAYMFKTYLGINPATGKKKYTTRRGFRTQKEAKIALARLEVMVKDKTIMTESSYTFSQIKDMWLEQYKSTVRESTYLRVKFLLESNISKDFSDRKIQSYKVVYCQDVVNKWKQNYSTYRALKSYTSAIFDYAKKMNVIPQNPMDDVSFSTGVQKSKQDRIKYYEKDELKKFLKVCEEDKFPITHPFFRVLAFTGLRKGEALALTWEDVDFEEKTVNVNKTVVRNSENKLITTDPKTRTSIRTISLDAVTMKLLLDWKKKQEAYLKVYGQDQKEHGQLIFPSKNNQFIDLTRMNNILSRLSAKCELPDITIHGFRHTHCSLLFEAGLSMKEVQERLGHSDIHTTMNVYTHVTKSQKERAADKFSSYVDF